MLRGYMMRSAYDFCSQNDAWVKRVWGVVGLEIKHELLGESLNPVIDGVVLPKSIQKTASFAKFTSDKEFIRNSLYYHCHRACTKLRKLEMKAQSFGIMLRTKDFRILSTEAITLPYPTDSELELNRVISKLFSRVFESNLVYRSSGVYVGKLIQNNALQLSLLRGEDSKRAEKISRVWDKIDKKYGKGKISLGRSGVLNMQNDET